jgi:nucleotide-binding universal stress UspA family protein
MKQQNLSQRIRFDRPATLTAEAPARRTWNVRNLASLDWNRGAIERPRKFRTITVPLDGTRYAEHALPYALALARRSGASLRLIQAYSRLDAIDPWQMNGIPWELQEAKQNRLDYLHNVARRIARIDIVPVETVLLDGENIVDSLVRGASGADLMVLASRRRSLASRLWWNSTFDRLRRKLPIPVHLTQGYSSPVDLTADPMPRHILVPLDGSILARSILQHATDLTGLEGATLTLLNVQNGDWSRGFFEHTNPRDYLLSAVDSLKFVAPSVEAYIITTQRSPAQAIAEFAEQNDVDLIALATRGDHGLSRLMRGSITDTLARRTRLPIVVRNFGELAESSEQTAVAETVS